MVVGRGAGGLIPPGFLNLMFFHQIFSKNGCFLSFEWLAWNLPLLPPTKIFLATHGKSTIGPLWKTSLRRPCTYHGMPYKSGLRR